MQHHSSDEDSDSHVKYNLELINIVRNKNSEGEKIAKIKDLISKGADINFKDANRENNTPLQFAVRKGEREVIDFLLRQGADVSSKNTKEQNSLEIAKLSDKPNKQEIVDLLEAHLQSIALSPSLDRQQQTIVSRNGKVESLTHEETQVNSKNGVIQSLNENEKLVSNNQARPYEKRKGTAGVSGQFYEIKLLMVFLLQGVEDDKIDSFHLATNMEKAGVFDDVVFRYKYRDNYEIQNSKTIFLQAKHRENKNKVVHLETLFSDTEKGDFLLKKYFSSYREINNKFSQSENSGDPIFDSDIKDTEFVIFTNALFKYHTTEKSNIVSRKVEKNSVFYVLKEENQYFQLTFDGTKKERIINTLQYSSDCKKLASDLAACVDSEKEIDLNKPIIKKYHFPLAEIVIEKVNNREGRLKQMFIDGDESLSSDTKIFRKIFFEEILKIKESNSTTTTSDLQSELKSKSLKLQEKFGDVDERDSKLPLPSELISEAEIEEFLSKFKLFAAQPNEKDLEETVKQKIQSIYRVGQTELNPVFSDTHDKIKTWWQKEDGDFLTETNSFFQDSARTSFWFDVKHPVDLFTGRRQEISDLHSKVQQCSEKITVISQMATISGLGGIGKTELAREYIRNYSKEHYDDNIIWINAESEGTLIESFSRLANDRLGIMTKDEHQRPKAVESIVGEVYKFFSKRKSLFLFDNADNGKYLRKFLPIRSLPPDANKPYILITSRTREWESGIDVLNLNELTLEDAVNFVKKGLGLQEDLQGEDIKVLVKKLQCFPLAIKQAVAYIQDQRKTRDFEINDYMEEYERKTKDILNSKVFQGIVNDYSKTTFTTWQITISKIKSNLECGEAALKILDILAYFAPDKINRDVFLNVTGDNEEQLRSAVRLLVKYSLVNGEQKQSVLNIHRLVQEVIRLELKAQNKEKETLRASLEIINGAYVEEESVYHISSIWSYASEYNELIDDFYFNSSYGEKMTPLHLLARNGLTRAANSVLKQIHKRYPESLPKMVNMPDGSWYGITPLHEAAQYGNIDIVKLLVKNGAQIDSFDREGWNPCILAMRHNNWEIAVYLRDTYASVVGNAESILGRNPLEKEYNEFVLSNKIERSQIDKLNIIKLLIEDRGKQINIHEPDIITGRTSLIDYSKQGELGVVKYLLEEAGANILDKDNEGSTALHSAAANNKLHIVEYLVGYLQKSNMDINPIDQYGATPLFAAAFYYHRDVIIFLLKKGAIADIVSGKEMIIEKLHTTLLHLAAIYDDEKMVKFLIEEKGQDKDVGKGISYTPLHAAALFNSHKVIDYLVDIGADVNVNINAANMASAFVNMKASINKSVGDRLPPLNSIVGLLEKNSSTPYAICKAGGFCNRRLQEATAESSTDTTCLEIVLKVITDERIRQWIMFVMKKKDKISREDVNISEQTPGSESN